MGVKMKIKKKKKKRNLHSSAFIDKNQSIGTYRVDNLFIPPIYAGIEPLIKQFLRTLHEKEKP